MYYVCIMCMSVCVYILSTCTSKYCIMIWCMYLCVHVMDVHYNCLASVLVSTSVYGMYICTFMCMYVCSL